MRGIAVVVSALILGGTAQAQGIEGRHVETPNARIWCLDSGGEGEVVLFLHANTGSSETFRRQFADFGAAGFRTLACDRRSAGQSTAADRSAGSVAGDTLAVMDALGIDSADIVGIAGGGFAALDFAASHPDRTRTLVVAGSNGSVQEEDVQHFREAARIPQLEGEQETEAYLELSPTYRVQNPDGMKEWIEIEARAHAEAAPGQKPVTPNTYAKLQTITAPTITIAGGADLISPPAQMAMYTAHIPGAELIRIPEVGHAISWEVPETFNKIVIDFIRAARS